MISRKVLQVVTIILFLSGFGALSFADSMLASDNEGGAEAQQQKPANPCNPCARKAQNPCNPCAKKAQNPCNPCGGKMASSEVYTPATSYSGWLKINSKPILSHPHANMFVTTFANPIAQAAIKSKAGQFPVGSILVKESHMDANGKPGAKGTTFAMEKTAEGWLWVTTDPSGHVTGKGDSQQMQMCSGCHQSAQTDSAFLREK